MKICRCISHPIKMGDFWPKAENDPKIQYLWKCPLRCHHGAHFLYHLVYMPPMPTTQGNARVYTLTQEEVKASTSLVVADQISIAHTLAYILIDSEASHSFVSTTFIKNLDLVPIFLNEVCVVSLPSEENLTLWFSFKEVPVKVTRKELPFDLMV